MINFHCLIFSHDKTYINIISNEMISHESQLSLEKIPPIPLEEGGRDNFLSIISANCFSSNKVVTLKVYIQYLRGRMLDLIILEKLLWEALIVSCFFCLLFYIGHKPFKVILQKNEKPKKREHLTQNTRPGFTGDQPWFWIIA